MGQILIGISSWADPELIASGFYPPELKTPGERLHHYALNFPVVEMDSSYHFLPTRRNLAAWIDATPPGFIFDVKAFSLFTQHPTPLSALPREMRAKAESSLNKEGRLYLHNLPVDIVEELWKRFAQAILPLYSAGKLGPVSFQFPSWFHPGQANYEYISQCQKKLPQYRLAVEFRTGNWLNEEHQSKTLQFLREKGLGLVCVDEPQGFQSSVPPVSEVTASLGVVRFHGRNRANWEKKDLPPNEKYNYLYNEDELREWAPKIRRMAETAQQVYVIFKNKHFDFAVRNARRMQELLFSIPSPSPSPPVSF